MDNVMIERSWRSLKYECLYLREIETGRVLSDPGMVVWLCDKRRPHSSLGWLTPEEFREKNIACNPVGTTNLQVVYAVG